MERPVRLLMLLPAENAALVDDGQADSLRPRPSSRLRHQPTATSRSPSPSSLTGVANGALQYIFSPTGHVIDDDGVHVPTIRIAACCKIVIAKNMISSSGESPAMR
ncbi:hypothetical protein GCM10022248_89820 [Nonomuraea soli]